MMASPVLVPLEEDEYYYGKIGDRKLRRRAEWLQRYEKQNRKAKAIKEKKYAGPYRYDFCVYYDCSDLSGGATFIVRTEYGYRCAEVLGTPIGNMLVCVSCCGSPEHDEKRRAWWKERIYRERKRLAKSLPMTAALQAKMRKEWGLTW